MREEWGAQAFHILISISHIRTETAVFPSLVKVNYPCSRPETANAMVPQALPKLIAASP
jgi:hypothetical protein